MKKSPILIALILCCCTLIATAQSSPTQRKGDKNFERYDFTQAIKFYEKIRTKDLVTLRKLAESYRYLGNTEKAETYYAQCVTLDESISEDIYYYAAMLRSNGKYEESEAQMELFHKAAENDSRGLEHFQNQGLILTLTRDEGHYEIKNLDINSYQEDFGAIYYKDQMVFASSREGEKGIRRRWNWNNLPFLDLYVANKGEDEQLVNAVAFDRKLNNKYHEGPASFAQNGSFIAFTRNNYQGESSEHIIKLQIFTEDFREDKWTNEASFPYNSDEYSIGHPALSEDGTIMYFASDMPGGYGSVDLYKSLKTDSGWSKPVNLGPNINTEGKEMFPFLHPDGYLIFASDGHVGLGGLDNFIAQIKDNDAGYSKVQNMGYPLNDKMDDFCAVLDHTMKKGYFSSNRPGGSGDDDIYSFKMLKAFTFGKTIRGTAKDKEGNIVANASVELKNSAGEIVGMATTNEEGTYSFDVDTEESFELRGSNEDYFEGTNTASTEGSESEVVADVVLEKDPGISLFCLVADKETSEALQDVKIEIINNLTGKLETVSTGSTGEYRKPLVGKKIGERISFNLKIEKEGYLTKVVTYNQLIDRPGQYNVHEVLDFTLTKMEVGMDIAKIIDIKPIYFDVNKSEIREDAAIELDKIVQVMNDNPVMEVELGSHTDCRASAAYNLSLSDRRAKSSAEYIQDKIVDPERIYGKGYGESKLVNKCECEGSKKVPCTEEEHQDNRRTEFTIIKM